ncbi:guanylate kinase [Salinisphaera sp. USBA-960]|nr:guanylate kinase [Salifodinibacter halophilus]NNC26812.1 guanylate kinase [Salifodinibacter halophilus]
MADGNGTARGQLVVISAPSGGGKTSLTRALIDRMVERGQPARFSISHTTRAPRPGEVDGRDYFFVDEATFESMIERGAFLEYARVFDRYYGTSLAETERGLTAGEHVMLDIDWQGARQVRAKAPDAVTIFIRPPDRDELEARLRARGSEDETAIAHRLAEADEELAHADEFDHVIANDSFGRALGALDRVVDG